MAIDPNNLPASFRRCMEPSHPASAHAQAAQSAKHDAKLEREMHEQFAGWLRIQEVEFIHSRMDRKSTIESGWPDFTVLPAGRPAFSVEFKLGSNDLSDDQVLVIGRLQKRGHQVAVAYTVGDAIAWARPRLGQQPEK